MGRDDKDLRKAIEKLETREAVIEYELEATGAPTQRQKRTLEALTRLQNSLRGPEEALDKHGYSRPFPPKPTRRYSAREEGTLVSAAKASD